MRRLFFGLVAIFVTIMLNAQGVKPLPTLHVDGKWLVDTYGNHVVLHGVMDTPNMYFNGWRWGDPWGQSGQYADYNDAGVAKCLNYFEKVFTGLEKAKCNIFRLHLDPAWTNDNSYTYSVGTAQPESEAKDEADIRHFNPNRLNTYLTSLYFPLMQKAMDHGMYVVVRPPGVCPPNLKVGDYYQQYLLEVWDIVSKMEEIQQYAGQISLELANEPVNLKDKNGNDNAKALHDYFQPIVDKIRSNGFTGIIWIPGTGWQSNYTSYATYPITGNNIGYAVHDYTGWYGCSDESVDKDNNLTTSKNKKINQFKNQVPVVENAPIIITEVDWSPKKPGEGHYNEHNEWVEPNYGTWSTGSTSKWGQCYKAMLDHYGNISMTLSSSACLIDIDKLLADGSVTPAFGGEPEACGKACMDWYAEYYKVNWPHEDKPATAEEQNTALSLSLSDVASEVMIGKEGLLQVVATYKDGHKANVASKVTCTTNSNGIIEISNGKIRGLREGEANVNVSYTDLMGNTLTATFKVRSTFFPFGEQYIKTDFFDNGTYTEKTRSFLTGLYGQMGWEYLDGVDMSGYKYLVIKLKEPQSCGAHLNIFTANSIWSSCCASSDFRSDTQIVMDLSTVRYTSGDYSGLPLDTKNIHIIDFWSYGGSPIVVEDVFLSNDDVYEQPAVATNENLTVGSTTRNMIVYAPKRLPEQPPLVIACHGANQDAAYLQNAAKFESVADTAKFVVVYANGVNKYWDIDGNSDLQFMQAIIDEMHSRYNVDLNRVYLTGFSMGGMFTYYAASKMADKFAAFAPVSGYLMGGPNATSSRPVPILHTHGSTDDVCVYDNVQQHINAWVKFNGCSTMPETIKPYPKSKPDSPAKLERYKGGRNGVEVALLTLDKKGHWWSMDEAQALTSEEVWNFCKRYSLDMTAPEVPTVTVDADNPKLELSKAFSEGNCVPDGWTTYDSSEGRMGYSNGYSQGCRILQLTGNPRDFDYGFYFRNISGGSRAGYVKYGAKGSTTNLKLAPGRYELRYKICSWNRAGLDPVSICVEKTDDGTVVGSQEYKPTVNIGNSASNSFSGVQEQTFSFEIATEDNYALAFYTQDAGWADAIIGSLTFAYIIPGDVNSDDRVDRDDVTCLISHLLGQKPSKFSATAADVNRDGKVNIADVTRIIGIILTRTSRASSSRAAAGSYSAGR